MVRKGIIFIVSVMVIIILSLPLNMVQAKDGYSSIQVVLNKVNIAINGVVVASSGMDYTLPDGNIVPFSILYKGTTYLPMRKMAELVGKNVTWDGATNTAGINTSTASRTETVSPSVSSNKTEQSLSNCVISVVLNKINIAIDGSIVGKAGMNYTLANGEQVPYSILYKGTTYLPMRKVAELVGKEVKWDPATNTAGINDFKASEEPAAAQKPMHIQDIEPIIRDGEALLKINFKLPAGSVMINDREFFSIICDTVSSNGVSKRKSKNIGLIKGSNSYTTYMVVDTADGSASCKIHYTVNIFSGYLNGILTEKGTKVLPGGNFSEEDLGVEIEMKEGSTTEVTIDAIKGVLFSTRLKWSIPAALEPRIAVIEFIERFKDRNEENRTALYYTFQADESEKEVIYTFANDKEYSLAVNIKGTKSYYVYGNISISDEAQKTGRLVYKPIVINDIVESREQLLQEKVNDIIARIIKPGMSDVDKEYAIFKYIKNNTIYGFIKNSGNAYGCLLEGVSTCEGYAEGTKKLLDAAGIENQIAYGHKGNGVDGAAHAWNIVKIGAEYFHLDALHNRFNMNDDDAKSEHYVWEEGTIPVCNSRFSMRQGLSFFIEDGYIYYTTGDNRSFYFDINRCRPDGSEDTKLFTTKNGGSFILHENGWIYYFIYEGSNVYRVRIDGSGETLLHSFGSGVRIHNGDILNNALYFLVETGVNGAYDKRIIKIDIGNLDMSTIATFGENMNLWKVGDYFYYFKGENGKLFFYKMTLDGSLETLIY